MTSRQYIKLAESLPPRLTRFFARYPPPALSTTAAETPNPFVRQKHPITGRWHDPVFSLRRQAELVKLARQHGVEELLPFTVKATQERIKRRAENGLRVKGTGVGQKVKGKEAERTMRARLEKRRQAMLNMPRMIQEWKQRGHGRGWKKWPK
ncbi:hypothetical protein OIDMADRAFT_192110 [Oidiodendron maius Zn]|uniref:Large ribosomal subunit protein mL59 domain-containing protein n=1 Tax=Oidiodendron maius (strain Zn) TaxID=913774 RepID=A0A0C3HP23_OIDMZ|nr:hypothetical protein OIDMADRAFT_192110 [Oidiodendron maius Zn]